MDINTTIVFKTLNPVLGWMISNFKSPLKISLVDRSEWGPILADKNLQAMVTSWWVPGPPNTPPGIDIPARGEEYPAVEAAAFSQKWLPIESSRLILKLYNNSEHPIRFKGITVKSTSKSKDRLSPGRSLQPSIGGATIEAFKLQVRLHSNPKESIVEEVPHQSLTSPTYELSGHTHVHIVVDAGYTGAAADPEFKIINWRLYFHILRPNSANKALKLSFPKARRKKFQLLARPKAYQHYYISTTDDSIVYQRVSYPLKADSVE